MWNGIHTMKPGSCVGMAGRLRRGEVRLVRFPPTRQAASGSYLTHDSILGTLARVTVAPITSTIRGIPTEVVLGVDDGMKGSSAVNLDNVTTIPQRLLGRRVTSLGPERMAEVCAALAFAVACVPV
jgi:mRNA interferase MazF